jgi:hypothetical protein
MKERKRAGENKREKNRMKRKTSIAFKNREETSEDLLPL